MTWPAVDARAQSDAVLLVPIGSTEQHGPHLPLSTDTDIAKALCDRVAESPDVDVIIAPEIAYGASGEHAGYAGTISIGQDALEFLIVELGRSASETFERILLVSAHGGNAGPVHRAAALLQSESRDVRAFQARWDGDAHAGRTETSIQLALQPERVQMDLAVVGDTRPLAEILPTMRSGGVMAVSASGVLGDPTDASPSEGATLLKQLCTDLRSVLSSWTDEDLTQ
jgi:mycofactocin precursor peptide peptidase